MHIRVNPDRPPPAVPADELQLVLLPPNAPLLLHAFELERTDDYVVALCRSDWTRSAMEPVLIHGLNRATSALLDTGASVNFVSQALAAKIMDLPPSSWTALPAKHQITLADHSKVLSTTTLTFATQTHGSLTAIVVPTLSQDLILGRPYVEAKAALATLLRRKALLTTMHQLDNGSSVDLASATASPDHVQAILDEYADVFTEPKTVIDRGKRNASLRVTADAQPRYAKNFHFSVTERKLLDTWVADMLSKGWIEPSSSPWASPVFFAGNPHKSGERRIVIDYRKLNAVTIPSHWPLPRIQDLLRKLQQAEIYSVLDARKAYYQLLLAEDSRDPASFTTPKGQYRPRVVMMGLKNAVSDFQRFIDSTIRGDPIRGEIDLSTHVSCYLDDIVVSASDFQTHDKYLRLLLQRFRAHRIHLHAPKPSDLFTTTVNFCGYTVSHGAIQPDRARTAAVDRFPLTTPGQALTLLGFCGYWREHIPNFSVKAAALYDYANGKIGLTASVIASGEQLKAELRNAVALARPALDKPYVIHTDASLAGVGAVLSQAQAEGPALPIAFMSKRLKGASLRWPIFHIELFAIYEAVRQFRVFLDNGQCHAVYTDHRPLCNLMSLPATENIKINNWLELLSQFDLNISYLPGEFNSAADALSRYSLASAKINHFTTIDACAGMSIADLLPPGSTYINIEICPNLRSFAKTLALANQLDVSNIFCLGHDLTKTMPLLQQNPNDILTEQGIHVHCGMSCQPFTRAGLGRGRADPRQTMDAIHDLLRHTHQCCAANNVPFTFLIECTPFAAKCAEDLKFFDTFIASIGGQRYNINMRNFVPTNRLRFIWTNLDLSDAALQSPRPATWADCLRPSHTPPWDPRTHQYHTFAPTITTTADTWNSAKSRIYDLQGKAVDMIIPEREMIMGFKAGHTGKLPPRDRLRALGNAIPRTFNEWVIEKVVAAHQHQHTASMAVTFPIAVLDEIALAIKDAQASNPKWIHPFIPDDGWNHDGVMLPICRDRLLLPPALLEKYITAFHQHSHRGIRATAVHVGQLYVGHNFIATIRKIVGACDVCSRAKHSTNKYTKPMPESDIPSLPYQVISIDFLEKIDSHHDILVISDQLTKSIVLCPTDSTLTGKEVGNLLHEMVFCRFGMPRRILLDRDPIFTSAAFQQLCKRASIQPAFGSPFRKGTTASVERTIRTIREVYRTLRLKQPATTWQDLLSSIEYIINTSFHSAIGCTPFKLLYGFEPPNGALPHPHAWITEDTLADLRTTTSAILQNAKQTRARASHLHRRRSAPIHIGKTRVFVSTRVLQRNVLKSAKVAFLGPYLVVGQEPHGRYTLDIGNQRRSFNRDDLRIATSDPSVAQPADDARYAIDRLLGHRLESDGTRSYHVSWFGFQQRTWEPESSLQQDVPELLKDYNSRVRR